MRVFTLLNALHEWQFERKLAKEHRGNKVVKTSSEAINDATTLLQENDEPVINYREFYSFQQFKKMNETIKELNEKVSQ